MKYIDFDVYDDDDNLLETLPAILYSDGTNIIAQVPDNTTSVSFIDASTGQTIQTATASSGKAILENTFKISITVRVGNPTMTRLNEITVGPSDIKTFADLQQDKIAQITDDYEKATATFTSSALGSIHTYLADPVSMSKFDAEYTYVNSASYDGKDVKWYTIEEGGVDHTKEQFNQVWLDGRNLMSTLFDKWDTLIKQVKSATTIDEVNSITW